MNSICELQSCFKKCTEIPCVDLCTHMYTCSCPDSNLLCKHIHKIYSLCNNLNEPDVETSMEFSHTELDQTLDNEKKEANLWQKFQTLMVKLENQMTNPEIRESCLEYVVSSLENLVKTNSAACEISDIKPLTDKFKVHSNQKFEKQPQFSKSHKSRKQSNNKLKAPTSSEKIDLLKDDTSHNIPSVRPYPPVRYVQRNSPINQLPSVSTNNFINENGEISIPNNFLIPPSSSNIPITVTLPSGKKMKIISSTGQISDKNIDDAENA